MTTPRTQLSPWRLGAQLARYRPGLFALGMALWIAFWAVPAATGLVLQAIFDRIGGQAGFDLLSFVALLLAVEGTRLVVLYWAIVVFTRWWVHIESLLRRNLLAAQLANRREEQGEPVTSASEAIPVFRDDSADLVKFVDTWLDVAGTMTFGVIAVAVMIRVDPTLTLVVALPLVAVFLVMRVLAERLRHVRRADREATVRVTGYLGTLFSSVQALKVAGAEDRAVDHLRTLNAARRRTALKDRVLNDSLDAFGGSTVDLSIGLVLLLVATSMRAGEFTVGDLALFASYIAALASIPRWAGLLLARHRHAQVAASRMGALLPDGDASHAVTHHDLQLDGARPPGRPRETHPGPAAVELIGFGTADGRVHGIDLRLAPGSFTVVCGEVGSGKSSLLRAMLGLAGPTEGTLRWNGREVTDLAAHMTPPRCAYVPQVPRLFSDTLRENLTVGLATTDGSLSDALQRAAFDTDLDEMRDGLDTLVGPRGVRLSGGQLQRAATSRALVADPGLLVLDDLSSALDAATERRVWERVMAEQRATVLAVSHRAGALERADQVVVLSGGEVAAAGTLDELCATGIDPLASSAPGRRSRK
jgi:ATP-binding cassette, subfamily B, bacterial